ncbi:MAG: hypothetical protein AAB288_03715, partial [Acidobacteriota bacterium]
RLEPIRVNDLVQTETTPTPRPIDPRLLSLPISSLCDRLGQIKLIDDRVPEDSDDLYKAIVAKGKEALPCLIEKIDERTKTPDPRTAPKWQHFTVGDTALFTVLHIASKDDYKRWKELFLAPLPLAYREEWKTNGVYAYFNYVSEPKNRKALQNWWKNWLKGHVK